MDHQRSPCARRLDPRTFTDMKSYELSFYLSPDDACEVKVVRADNSENTTVFASAKLWWRDTPMMDGRRIGAIGEFEADDGVVAGKLLEGAADYLREKGCHFAVGPMNRNTWQHHRLVIESSGRGTFLLEPRNPAEYPGWWESQGFSVLSRYSSSVIPLDGREVLSAAVRSRLIRSGLVVRKLDALSFEDELRIIYAISLKSFTNNFLYTPLDKEAFLAAYRKVRDQVDAECVTIAERDGVPCGFVFGIPDLEAAARGEKPAIIVKTLAVDPGSGCAGLGSLLVDELHRISREKGYSEAIHALQHESNTSLKITGRHHGEVIRRYALFSRRL